ncbi:SDR family NAD(P)-dependent oxidoreductase [Peribacillus sp. NPDC058002]|uniref:SDR family NAD(P)-dependent oxidoreductase n=1 Tax=Peribacillus sp. NPDC058002 TaxID=3346301 RepID=UPI0036DC31BE
MQKRVVVTGGNSGIGREAVQEFLKQGDKVIFTSRSTKLADEVLSDLKEYSVSGNLFFCECDSSRVEDVRKLVQFTNEKIGGCDVLVNSAAIFIGGNLHEVDEYDFDLQMNINVKGIFLTSKYFIPQMLERKSGSIINISSLAGKLGGYNCAIYSATKAAVNNLTRSMALDYAGNGVRVNAVCPSATATKMFMTGSSAEVIEAFQRNNPSGRIGKPKEIVDLIIFLASEKSSYITGQCISIDGGLSAWSAEVRQDKLEVKA